MTYMKVSDVFKKDLRVLVYLISFGAGTLLSQYLGANEITSVLFGAAVNYILYRIKQELEDDGYFRALKK